MKFVLVFQAILATYMILCDARHGLDHHGRHHEDFRHFQHGWKIDLKKMETPKNETISIDVTRKSSSSEGNEKSTMKVSLRVHIVKGGVHINGQKIDHSVVTSVHIRTIVEEVFSDGKVTRKPAMIQVRAIVSESTNANGVKIFSFQEEIVEVEDDEVDQIEVKEIVLELGDNINESKRTLNIVKISESNIHKHARNKDKHLWACRGRLPKVPFHISREEMKRWKHRHPRPPMFETGQNKDEDKWSGRDGDDDDDDDDDKDNKGKHGHGKRHHHRHHHGPKRWMRHFCNWFHKLPVATRAAFCLSVILFGILIFASCWACCCRKPRSKPSDAKYELDDTVSVNEAAEAEPLPCKKKQLDEQPLLL
ncbi:uncharacterized protein LOC135685196 [Rhopilema esculentum]|uniref:uncharacterized protein LOC135685196 n=1 Tax=Rhopilema esculentum TaxID=499914 RepID=UPI0031D438FA